VAINNALPLLRPPDMMPLSSQNLYGPSHLSCRWGHCRFIYICCVALR